MPRGFDLAGKVAGVLSRRPSEALAPGEIASLILEAYPADCEAKRTRKGQGTTKAELLSQIAREVYARTPHICKAHPEIGVVGKKPRKLRWGNSTGALAGAKRSLLSDRILDVLQAVPGHPLPGREIMERIISDHSEILKDMRERYSASDDKELQKRLRDRIWACLRQLEKQNPMVHDTQDSPRRWSWGDASDTPKVPVRAGGDEAKLYPLIMKWLSDAHNVRTKRIDERRSSNRAGRGANHWMFPDIVGMEDLTRGWRRETLDLASEASARKARLWSVEAKLSLNRSNVRSTYFQAVSNSSWANYGYLAAAEIHDDAERALRTLAALHGIGVALVDRKDPMRSRIVVPARERPEIDWATADELAHENRGFREFLNLVRDEGYRRIGGLRGSGWDN